MQTLLHCVGLRMQWKGPISGSCTTSWSWISYQHWWVGLWSVRATKQSHDYETRSWLLNRYPGRTQCRANFALNVNTSFSCPIKASTQGSPKTWKLHFGHSKLPFVTLCEMGHGIATACQKNSKRERISVCSSVRDATACHGHADKDLRKLGKYFDTENNIFEACANLWQIYSKCMAKL